VTPIHERIYPYHLIVEWTNLTRCLRLIDLDGMKIGLREGALVRSRRKFRARRPHEPRAQMGDFMALHRLAAGLTQAQAAKRAKYSQRRWCNYELGNLSPRMATLAHIARVLKCAPRDLMP